ncbi:putative ABC transport system permease protein [Jatrophihabitans sp. GAS493]|uniref:ABC transporter permease n=1 Tax=Jatrophihabitans sp. GAS493 TaxID=1907575 RepID=UPI000BC0904F|nr:FtsX-like permease family protein [Jatrophihabitans sp. GAS493]SOD70379.1 putative ABC transport system permease protein [Jatrophihabitans sp. GAS493]
MASGTAAMRRVSLRNLAAHKVRLALTVISVVLGTAFVAGSFVFTDTLQKSFDNIFSDTYKGVAVRIQPVNGRSAGVPSSLLTSLTSVEGVSKVEPEVNGPLVLVAADGKPVQSGGAPSIGMAWLPAEKSIEAVPTLSSGSAPTATGQVAVNEGAAKKADLKVGDQTKVISATGGIVPVTISGVYSFKTETGGYVGILFPEAQAFSLFTDGTHVAAIDVAATPGVSETELRDRISAELPQGIEAVTGTKARADIQSQIQTALQFINYILLAFGLIALVVGTFIIYNTFSMLVAQRLRELALLRAIGADKKQVTRSVLLEAFLVGLIGSVLGIAGGVGLAYGLKALLDALDLGLPGGPLALEPRTVIVGVIVGVGVTMLSAYAPARRAARTPPVAAMRAEFASVGTSLRRRTITGTVLTLLGAAAAVAGVTSSSAGAGSSLLGLALLAVAIGVLLLSPVLSKWIIGLLALVVRRPFGAIGRLASSNAIRNPRRTAATAFALTLGLMLVSAIAVIGASTKQSIDALVDTGTSADYIISAGNTIAVPAEAAAAIAKVPGVGAYVELYSLSANLGDSKFEGQAVDGNPADVFTLKMLSGTETVSASTMIADKTTAADHGWKVGSEVKLTQRTGEQATVRISGIYADNVLLAGVIASGDTYRALTPATNRANDADFVKAAPGTNLDTLRADILKVTDPYYVIKVQTKDEYKGEQASQINGLLGLLYGLLGLAIVIAILGIINTLALSVVERRREIGILRAVGMIRAQLRRTIYLESALISIFGAVLGVTLGLAFGSGFTHVLRDTGLGTLSVPWGQAVAFLVVAAVVGVLAALWPAFRAARTRPLDAIAE